MLICIMHTVICQLIADSTKKKDVHTIVAGASSSMAYDAEREQDAPTTIAELPAPL